MDSISWLPKRYLACANWGQGIWRFFQYEKAHRFLAQQKQDLWRDTLTGYCIRYGFLIKKGRTILFQFLSFKNLTFISVFGFRGAGRWSVLRTLEAWVLELRLWRIRQTISTILWIASSDYSLIASIKPLSSFSNFSNSGKGTHFGAIRKVSTRVLDMDVVNFQRISPAPGAPYLNQKCRWICNGRVL